MNFEHVQLLNFENECESMCFYTNVDLAEIIWRDWNLYWAYVNQSDAWRISNAFVSEFEIQNIQMAWTLVQYFHGFSCEPCHGWL